MRARRSQIGHARALIIGGNFEPHPRACAVLFKDQRNILALQRRLFGSGVFRHLQVRRQFQQKGDFARCEIAEG